MSDERTGRRPRRGLIVAGVVIVVSALVVSVWLGTAWQSTYRQAQAVQASVALLRAALSAQEWKGLSGRVDDASSATSDLVESTSEVPWRVLSALPFVGSTASAVDQLALSVSGVLDAAAPLVPLAERVAAGEVRGADGAIDLALVQEAAAGIDALASALAAADGRLASVDVAQVRPEVAGPIADFREAIAEAAPTLASASDMAHHAPSLLGADGKRNWLVLLQNPAEARGSGGFVGAYAIITADHGRLAIASSGTSTELASMPIPTEGAPEEDRVMWGDLLGAWNDYNLSPHFPLTAELSVAGMRARGTPVDGVIAIDPAVVAALMAVTGPVTAEGRTITADDVEQFFVRDVYAQYPDAAERDVVSMALVNAVVTGFMGSSWDPQTLVDSLREPVEQGRVRVWSSVPAEQEWLAASPVGGVLPDTSGPVVAVTFNDAAASKTDAFVETGIDYAPGQCPTSATQHSSLRVTVRNAAPAGLPAAEYGRNDDPSAPAGSTNLLVHLYLPVGSGDEVATLDGKPIDLFPEEARNRLAWWAYLPIERGRERVLDMTFTEPTVAGAVPRVIAQPMAIDTVVSIAPDKAC